MDHVYLNLAVYNYQQFPESSTNPHYTGDFTFGRPMKGHNYHPCHWTEFVRHMAAEVRMRQPAKRRRLGTTDKALHENLVALLRIQELFSAASSTLYPVTAKPS